MITLMKSESAVDIVLDEERYWQAILEKDASFDGVFFAGVRSTGVYCRPVCASRTPRRERVVFFATQTDAEEAGFRACLRCEPRREGPSRRELLVEKACRYLDEHWEELVTLGALGKRLNVSPFHLQRTFKRVTGVTPRQYAEARRLGRLKGQLRGGEPVTRAMYDAGYGSSSRLYENSSTTLGMTPGAYGRGGRGMRIAYMLADCPLGRLIVAATERGICHVSIADADPPLETGLRHEYPEAEIGRWGGGETEGLPIWADLISSHLSGRETLANLPLDIQVTAFQGKVYGALRSIASGSTASYSDVARQIGRPTAVRAVARACATNPAAIVIPCHRVIRENGDLGGYGLGVERKKKLLEMEAAGSASRAAAG